MSVERVGPEGGRCVVTLTARPGVPEGTRDRSRRESVLGEGVRPVEIKTVVDGTGETRSGM